VPKTVPRIRARIFCVALIDELRHILQLRMQVTLSCEYRLMTRNLLNERQAPLPIEHVDVEGAAREEGSLVGISAAPAVAASLQIALEEASTGRSAVIVITPPDSAEKYLSDRFSEGA